MLMSKRVKVCKGIGSPALCRGLFFLFLFLLVPVEVFAFGSGGPPPPLVVTTVDISILRAQILNGISGLSSSGEEDSSGSGRSIDGAGELINIVEDKDLSIAEEAEEAKIDKREVVILASKHSLVANDEDRIDIKKTGELVRKVNLAYFEREVRLVDLMSEEF